MKIKPETKAKWMRIWRALRHGEFEFHDGPLAGTVRKVPRSCGLMLLGFPGGSLPGWFWIYEDFHTGERTEVDLSTANLSVERERPLEMILLGCYEWRFPNKGRGYHWDPADADYLMSVRTYLREKQEREAQRGEFAAGYQALLKRAPLVS